MAIPTKPNHDVITRKLRNFGNLSKNIASGDGVNTGTRIPFYDDIGFLSRNMAPLIIQSKDDLPDPVAGVITLPRGVYWIDGFINITESLKIADGAAVTIEGITIFDGFLYLGVGSLFIGDNFEALGLNNCLIAAPFGNVFDFQPSSSTAIILLFEDIIFQSVAGLGNMKNLFQAIMINVAMTDIGQGLTYENIDRVFLIHVQINVWKNLGTTMLTFKGNFDNILLSNLIPSTGSNESLVFFEPTLTAVNINVSTTVYDNSNGGVFFQQGITGDIVAFADAGGGLINVTSFDHGLTTGDKIEIRNTENYNKGFDITVLNTDVFTIIAPFNGDDARGDFDTGSLKQDFLPSSYKANTRVADSIDFGSNFMITNATVTTITTQDVPVKVSGIWTPGSVERFIATPDGRLLHTGFIRVELETISTFLGQIPTGANKLFSFYFVIGNDIKNLITAFVDNGAGGTTVTAIAHGLSDDDRVPITNSVDYNITHTIFNVTDDTFDVPVPFIIGNTTGNWALLMENSKMSDLFGSTDSRSIVVISVNAFEENDYIELFVENNSGTTNITLDTARTLIR